MESKDDSRWLCKCRTTQVGQSWEEHQSRGVHSKIPFDAFLMCCAVCCSVTWMLRSRNLQRCGGRHNGPFVLHNVLIVLNTDLGKSSHKSPLDSKQQIEFMIISCTLLVLNVQVKWKRCLHPKVKYIHRSVLLTYPVSVIHISGTYQSIIGLNVTNQLRPVSAYTFFTFLNY